MQDPSLHKLSEQLLLAVKTRKDTTKLTQQLSAYPMKALQQELNSDAKKVAFWTNLYNAYFQILRKEHNLVKPAIYRERRVKIAGTLFSLDDMEHGILRKFRYKYSLGFFANIFTSRLIKKLAVDQVDYRIHFALNCGAESCPPIAFYNLPQLDAQLDMATQSFLDSETDYDDENLILSTTALFQWFLADFGGKKGIIDIYQKQLGKDISNYKIKYKKYSWEEVLDNYSE